MNPNDRVSLLIDETSRSWKVDGVKSMFSGWEANVICAIPLPPRAKLDRLFWNDTKSGLFSVRSAYHLQVRSRAATTDGESSVVGLDKKFWKFLWSLSLPPKVKSFLWRACVGILPTYALLQRRHLRSDGGCPGCTKDVESVGHILWSCPVANDVWVESQLRLHKWDHYISSFFDLMVVVQSRLSLEEVEFFSCVAYFLWRQRNAWVHERMACNPMAVVQRAVVLLRDYKSSCTVGDRSHVVVPRRSDLAAAQAKRDPPSEGVFKVNWDFLVDSVSKRMSVGIIIRDHNGYVLAAKCSNHPILSSDVQPKVLACLSALFSYL